MVSVIDHATAIFQCGRGLAHAQCDRSAEKKQPFQKVSSQNWSSVTHVRRLNGRKTHICTVLTIVCFAKE
jgi:hypothetical protein